MEGFEGFLLLFPVPPRQLVSRFYYFVITCLIRGVYMFTNRGGFRFRYEYSKMLTKKKSERFFFFWHRISSAALLFMQSRQFLSVLRNWASGIVLLQGQQIAECRRGLARIWHDGCVCTHASVFPSLVFWRGRKFYLFVHSISMAAQLNQLTLVELAVLKCWVLRELLSCRLSK